MPVGVKMRPTLYYKNIPSLLTPRPSSCSHSPKCGLAAVHPVVLWGAVPFVVLFSMVTAETDPEISISRAQLCDELLYEFLLGLGLHAQQLAPVSPAGELCLCEVQPPPELREICQLVTRLPFSCLAHALTCIHTHIVHVYTEFSVRLYCIPMTTGSDVVVDTCLFPTSGFKQIRCKSPTSSTCQQGSM